ncbi:hypothetical protein ACFLW0_05090 [Chloroflexota bacterium]
MRKIFIPLAVVVIVSVGGFFGYQAVYAMGETTGYNAGYPAGEEAGYSVGEQDGYTEGYTVGEQDGYEEGYGTGEQVGYEGGYEEGYGIGEQDGYEEGYSAGEITGYTSGRTDGYDEGHDIGYDDGVEAGLGHGYTLKDPTLSEVTAFLRADRTNENEYIGDDYGVYVCSHYARDICNNAEQEGIRCAYVELRYPDSGHAIIAFNTVDFGLVYFEPQSDERANPVTGKRYYQCIVPNPDTYYVQPDYDDTIMDILVIW